MGWDGEDPIGTTLKMAYERTVPLLNIVTFGWPGALGVGGPLLDTAEFRAPKMLRQTNLRKGFTTGTLEMDCFCNPLGILLSSMSGPTEDTAFPWPIRNHVVGLLRLEFTVV